MNNQVALFLFLGGLGVGSLAVGIVGAVRSHKREERENARKKFKNIYSNANAHAYTNLI